MLLTNATIHTITNGTIENGFLLIKDKKIEKIGLMSEINFFEEEVIDMTGLNIYPGFIDAHTHLGMFENGLNFEGDDGNEKNDPITPQLRAIDAINPLDKCFEESLEVGVTTVLTGPGSANPIAGQFVAIKTAGKRIDNMILKQPVAIKFALGENPKSVYCDKDQPPCTRMATAALIREQLYKAQRYLRDKNNAEENSDEYDMPDYDAKCEALIPLLNRDISAHFHAHRADDIFTAIRIAKEFSIDYVIIHGTEGHLIVDELKEENSSVLSGPFLCDRSKPELVNLTARTPGILANAGINTAIVTDHPVIPLNYLPICAALAVREGMSEEDAIRSITINPARICGIEDRVGSIEVGKDADLVVFKGNPLEFNSKPEYVFCDGSCTK